MSPADLIVQKNPYCCSSVVQSCYCCSVVTVNPSISLDGPTVDALQTACTGVWHIFLGPRFSRSAVGPRASPAPGGMQEGSHESITLSS